MSAESLKPPPAATTWSKAAVAATSIGYYLDGMSSDLLLRIDSVLLQ
jgi:hypothetical protein